MTNPTESEIENSGYWVDQGRWREAWALGYSGAGTLVGIIDDGFAQSYMGLDNYKIALDYDFRDDDDTPLAEGTDHHGNKVANVVVAQADGTATVGAAYGAFFVGYRIGYGSNGSFAINAKALDYAGQICDVINCSWGYDREWSDDFTRFYNVSALDALKNAVENGRGGLGAVIVFSAGNARSSGQDVNYHNFGNSPFTISVGAIGSTGKYASWSNPGYALTCCAAGVSIPGSGSGTSFAAPLVTGECVLTIEAQADGFETGKAAVTYSLVQAENPGLRWWEVRQIVALTCDKTDPDQTSWRQNAVGRWYNHNYGFGSINAERAVLMARNWQPLEYREYTGQGTDFVDVPDSFDVHTVEIKGNPIDHATLTSPSGTAVDLVGIPPGSSRPTEFMLLSEAHNGENSKGRWQFPGQFTITIRGASTVTGRPILITPIGDMTMAKFPYDMSQHFSDPNGGKLVFTADPKPGTVSIDKNTGIMDGTYDGDPVDITVTATNPEGLSVSDVFNLSANRPPVLVSPIPDIRV